jgi:hypothetical protein
VNVLGIPGRRSTVCGVVKQETMATFMDTSNMDAALMQFSDSLVPTDEFIYPAKEMITKVRYTRK